MANLLNNMLTLQVEHKIPMRMDLSTKEQLEYYEAQKGMLDSIDKSRLLQSVIIDLQAKLNPEI